MKYDFELDIESNNSLSIIIRQLKKNATILEFGPANGRLTKYMKEEMNSNVYLVELDERAGKDALKYGVDLVVGDIEAYQWKEQYKDIKFDHIIFADVLEHLRNPLQVLKVAKEFLKEDGTILLSVPNLAHNAVIIDLLNNKFEYNSIGLLDDTHIHFFTKTSLDKMITDAGLFVAKAMATYARVGTIEINNSINDVKDIKPAFWNKRNYGNVYQYVYEVKPHMVELEEKIDKVLNDYYFQAYYDAKGEWKEDNSIIEIINVADKEQIIDIEFDNKIGYIRIDPVNNNSIVKINKVVGFFNDEEVISSKYYSNEKLLIGNLYYFDNNDPQLSYKFETEINRMHIEYEIIDMDVIVEGTNSCVAGSIISEVEAVCKKLIEQEEKICSHDIENEMLKQTAQYEKERADILQAQRDALENKKIYKLYKFFKRK